MNVPTFAVATLNWIVFSSGSQGKISSGITLVLATSPNVPRNYTKLGFEPLACVGGELGSRPEPLPMFLPIQVIAKAIVR
ncbi:MAG: hypothetical protein L3K52_08335 [Candidatus Thiothrix sulfatifontis]|nr:MAG: hypothetical protein L3K52_08335 [Candidatus Thiothrix sulfatifontis]